MSFFLGLAKGFMWAQEQKQEREQFEADMAWEREKLLLSAKLSRQNAAYASRLQKQESTEEKIKMVTALTGDPSIAQKLYDTGMLDTFLMNLDRDDVDQAGYIRSVAEGLRATYGNDPDKIAQGLTAAAGESNPDAAATAAAAATMDMDDWFGIIRNPVRGVDRADNTSIRSSVDSFLERSGNFPSLRFVEDPSTDSGFRPIFDDAKERDQFSEARKRIFQTVMDAYTGRQIGWNNIEAFLEEEGSNILTEMNPPTQVPPPVTPPPVPSSTGALTSGVVTPPPKVEEDEFTSSVFRRGDR